MKTLIQPRDVPKYTSMQLPGNPCTFREIFHIEVYEFRHSLGDAYRKTLLEAMADYSNTELYNDETTYNEGDLVTYWINESLQVYRALTTTTAIPTTVADWELAPMIYSFVVEKFHLLPSGCGQVVSITRPLLRLKKEFVRPLVSSGQPQIVQPSSSIPRT